MPSQHCWMLLVAILGREIVMEFLGSQAQWSYSLGSQHLAAVLEKIARLACPAAQKISLPSQGFRSADESRVLDLGRYVKSVSGQMGLQLSPHPFSLE